MRRIIGSAFVSLDGVMQAPGAPEEDRSGGFALGGWMAGYFDAAVGERIEALFDGPFDLLLGRRTYDIFAAYWPFARGDNASIGRRFDSAAKYVLTRGDGELSWENSRRLPGLDALAEVKGGDGPPLLIQGSATLYPQLLAAGLVDRLVVMTFPVLLGGGKRLFGDGTPPRSMRMVEHQVTPTGTVIAAYEPGGEVVPGSFATEPPSPAELHRRARIEQGTW
ncbi:MAG: dihydrofolate reductase [Alphaproteobacteria bacterium]|nr:dihydrofolate reductase [Alphaproteobacteria bacterium]MBV9370537.1 dihydrofolate reductase [Alphaproteobacteria bacterium]MBV9900637.1 dihydrofolate reductase [Alphaproteobacteria bacterium]